MSREHRPRWGADLAAIRGEGTSREQRAIEVKGKGRANWSSVVLQQSQWERACSSASAGDDEWWLAICTEALAPTPPQPLQLSADWVRQNWPLRYPRRRGLGRTATGRLQLTDLGPTRAPTGDGSFTGAGDAPAGIPGGRLTSSVLAGTLTTTHGSGTRWRNATRGQTGRGCARVAAG